MPEDYASAALRHYTDAETLAGQKRFDNAGHLIGFAGECAVKVAIATKLKVEPKHEHFPKLLDTARRQFNKKYDSGMRKALDEIEMADWTIGDRYAPNEKVSEKTYNAWKADVRKLMGAAGLKLG